MVIMPPSFRRSALVLLVCSTHITPSLGNQVTSSAGASNPPSILEASAGTLLELADELYVDYPCLHGINPSKDSLKLDDIVLVPLTCCKYSCQGLLCGQRPECKSQTTVSGPLCTLTATASAVIAGSAGPATSSSSTTLARVSMTSIANSPASSTSEVTSIAVPSAATLSKTGQASAVPSTKASSSTANSGHSYLSSGSGTFALGTSSDVPKSATTSSTSSKAPGVTVSLLHTVTEVDGSVTAVTLPLGVSITGVETLTIGSSTVTVIPASSIVSHSAGKQTASATTGKSLTSSSPPGFSSTSHSTLISHQSSATSTRLVTTASSSREGALTSTTSRGSTTIRTSPSGSPETAPKTTSTISTQSKSLAKPPASLSSNKGSALVIDGTTLTVPLSVETITKGDASGIVIGPSGILEGSTIIPFPNEPSTIAAAGGSLTFGKDTSPSAVPSVAKSTGASLPQVSSTIKSPITTSLPVSRSVTIPSIFPSSGASEPQVAITFDSETYILPHTISVELLQSDGSIRTLFSNSIIAGTATVSIPPLASPTTISSHGLTIEAGPETRGSPASGGAKGFTALIDALKGLSSSANDIVNAVDQIRAQGVRWSAGSLTDSAFSSAIEGPLDSAINDISSFASTMSTTVEDMSSEVYEITEDGLRRIFPARTGSVEELDLLKSFRKLLRGITGLRKDVILKMKDYWVQGTAAAAALVAAEEALRNFGNYDWAAIKPTSSSTSVTRTSSTATVTAKRSSTSSSASSTATAIPYMFTTNKGTEMSTFTSYIKTLPDQGKGTQITFPYLTWQSYVTNLTLKQAQDVANQKFVDFVTRVNEHNDTSFLMPTPPTSLVNRVPHNENLNERPDSAQHLRPLSAGNQLSIAGVFGATLPNYLFDPLLGQGQTIYIVDGGFNLDHVELSTANGRKVTSEIVPNELMLMMEPDESLWAPHDITDVTDHGTKVASIAGGTTVGVASRADLVLVKFKNAAKNPLNPTSNKFIARGATEPALSWAWNFILSDVLQKRSGGNRGKFIVDMSLGFALSDTSGDASSSSGTGKQPLLEGMNEIMERILAECWENDIITVVATGNDGTLGKSLDLTTPQTLGTTTNGLITVGGVDKDGQLAELTSFDAGRGGSITTYAVSQNVRFAQFVDHDNAAYGSGEGTSVAAPAVAGLAAYFASLPSLAGQFPQGSVSTSMKDYIVKYAYRRLPLQGEKTPIPDNLGAQYRPVPAADSIKVAYNRAPDGLCAINAPPKRAVGMAGKPALMARQSPSGDQAVVVSGTILGSSLSQSYCSVPSTSSASQTSAVKSSSIKSRSSTSTTTSRSSSVTSRSSSTSINTAEGASIILSIFHGLSLSTTLSSTTKTTGINSEISTAVSSSPKPTTATSSTITYASIIVPATAASSAPSAPTINTNDGILTCGTRNDQGNAEYFFTEQDADNAMYQFCHNLTTNIPANKKPIVFAPGGDTNAYGTYTFVDNPDPLVFMSATWGALDDSSCPTLNMSMDTKSTYALCTDRLNVIINGCDTKEIASNLFWKQGGKFFRDCITWELIAWAAVGSI